MQATRDRAAFSAAQDAMARRRENWRAANDLANFSAPERPRPRPVWAWHAPAEVGGRVGSATKLWMSIYALQIHSLSSK